MIITQCIPNVCTACLLFLIRPEADGFHYEDLRVRINAVESQKTLRVSTVQYNLSYSILTRYSNMVHGTCLQNIGNNIILLLVSVYLYVFII